MGLKVKVTEKKSARFKEISKIIKGTKGGKLGIFKKDLAQIGAYHEFGTRDIPKRSFLRAWVAKNDAQIKKDISKAMMKIYKGDDELKVWEAVGKEWVKGIQKFIKKKIPPPLKDSTVKQKSGRYKRVPLVRSGALLRAIEFLPKGSGKNKEE